MPLALGCIADDYTGASDLANTLTRAGLRTVQTIGVPKADLALPKVDAVVVALKSRSIAPADAVRRSLDAEAWLREAGAPHLLFKICSTFDSTDAGNIGPVMDALMARAGARFALVTPAFPGTGRTVFQGHLFVGAVPLNESPLKDHPLNPMHDANLVRVLQRQTASRIALLPLATVARGAAALAEAAGALERDGMRAAIVDAVFDADLETIGMVALPHPVSVGASGLGLGLARAIVRQAGQGEAVHAAALPRVDGPAACLAGSCSRATLEQIAVAERSMPVFRLDIAALLDGAPILEQALAFADEHIGAGPLLIASSAAPEQVAAVQASHGVLAAGERIERAMAEIAARLVARGVRRLVVAGGETSGAVVDRLGLPAFLVGAEIAPGVPLLATLGTQAPMLLALKSGNFGGPDFFRDALGAMGVA